MSQATKQVRVVALDAPVVGQDFEPTAFFDEDGNPVPIGGGAGGSVAWGDIDGVPAALTAAQAAATASIRAIGTTATTAAAGNHLHTFTALTGTVAGVTGANLQLILNDLATRLAAVETP